MRRRTLLRWIASLGSAIRFPSLRAWAQTAGFPAEQGDTLGALAAVVLPSELGATGIRDIARRFEVWVRDYRPGAEMDHGYGFTRLRTKPASPAPAYLRQLENLRPALLKGDTAARRAGYWKAALEDSQTDPTSPGLPTAPYVAADLMAFYFLQQRCQRPLLPCRYQQ